jgi:hypothetical protein
MAMATHTPTLGLGAIAPPFQDLMATDGKRYSLMSFAEARLLAFVFISNGCPTVRVYEDRLAEVQGKYSRAGVQLVAINSNNPHLSPGDAYPEMVKRARDQAFAFPYLKDEEGTLARALGAVCTPHVFVFDQDRRLRYQGRVDDSRDLTKVTSRDLDNALEALVAGRELANPVSDPFGCSIVW